MLWYLVFGLLLNLTLDSVDIPTIFRVLLSTSRGKIHAKCGKKFVQNYCDILILRFKKKLMFLKEKIFSI